ncbi:glycoside hydrolase superfamily [Pilobolus umbonatus]|nr:glycoside hydrolase superfamily [Pilobolus umbonatus]
MDFDGPWFIDKKSNRTVLFKGINVGGGTKLPVGLPSHEQHGFWVDYDRKVTFIGRPFPLHEADEHFARLVGYGFNLIRFVVTWEALEHEGPGLYDEEYLDYLIHLLNKCGKFGLKVFIDPHQDCWSRHCGGSGHPGWTLALAGLNPLHFPETNAAIVHSLYPEPYDYPKMIWGTNYQKLAAATMFTLFFAGKTYAPLCTVNGVHLQDYLQYHYLRCIEKLASRIKESGLEDTVVIGYDSINEPGHGYLVFKDITKLNDNEVDLKKGLMPTPFQSMLLGSGIPTKVDYWEFKWNGPKKVKTCLVDPKGFNAWMSEEELDEVDHLFGWDRSWPAGCIWAHHNVWDRKTHQVLEPHYFATQPNTGVPTDYIQYWLDHLETYAATVRRIHTEAILFIQPPVMTIPPKLPESLQTRIVYAPHWYDGLTLVKKKWCNYNVDVINMDRGKYGNGPLRFVRALRIGEQAIRNCFVDQLKTIQQEGLETIGNHPCLLGEIGIPFDMDVGDGKDSASQSNGPWWNWFSSLLNLFSAKEDKNLPLSHPNSAQNKAMDANMNALEQNLLNYTLWNYTPDNDKEWGDRWNGEDLSIWQYIQKPEIEHFVPSISGTFVELDDTDSLKNQNSWPLSNCRAVTSLTENYLVDADNYSTYSNESDFLLYPARLNKRDIISVHRPHPQFTAGTPVRIQYTPPTEKVKASFIYEFIPRSHCQGPTEIYMPTRYFPTPPETSVAVNAGHWEARVTNSEYWTLIWWVNDQHDVSYEVVKIQVSLSNNKHEFYRLPRTQPIHNETLSRQSKGAHAPTTSVDLQKETDTHKLKTDIQKLTKRYHPYQQHKHKEEANYTTELLFGHIPSFSSPLSSENELLEQDPTLFNTLSHLASTSPPYIYSPPPSPPFSSYSNDELPMDDFIIEPFLLDNNESVDDYSWGTCLFDSI